MKIGGFPGHDELLRELEEVDAISFDFFGSLFTRPLADPEDVFDIMALQFSIADFRNQRRAAQAIAFQRMIAAERKEITLQNIYACLPTMPLSAQDLMIAEYKLELSLLEPNPEVLALLKSLLAAGRQVVITSDMYLSEEFFRDALRPHDLHHIPLFVSSDRNATKRDAGALYEIVVRELNLPADKVLHIGDNLLADVQRAKEKGLRAFHYQKSSQNNAVASKKNSSLFTSIGTGLLRHRQHGISSKSFTELGFLYGGPLAVGFLDWIEEQCRRDNIDHILFLSRDGFTLERIARQACSELPPFSYFLGSRTLFTLAAMTAENFHQFIPFLISGGDGLSPYELLERIGVPAPAPEIMHNLGLGSDISVGPKIYSVLTRFLFAYRWEILKVCQRNRRGLYQNLRRFGLQSGTHIALVDIGWNGTTQEAFEMATHSLMDLKISGYYFCLANSSECRRRAHIQRMSAMVNAGNTPRETIDLIYKNRLIIEQLFSAPHHTVIGLEPAIDTVNPIYDPGRGSIEELSGIAAEVILGLEKFAACYFDLKKRINLPIPHIQTASPIIELIMAGFGEYRDILNSITNFDAWGSSRRHNLVLADYCHIKTTLSAH